MRLQRYRKAFAAIDGRYVSSASTFSTILLTSALRSATSRTATRVLDVGCGRSPYRGLLGERIYVGIDRAATPVVEGIFVAGDATSLPVRDADFDGILCTEVIEHVEDERLLLREITRVASDGATLVLTSPFVHGLHEQPYDFRRLTSIGLVSLIEAHGWRVLSVRSIGGPMVVAIDSFFRWLDPRCQRAGRLLARTGSSVAKAPRGLSSSLQKGLALATMLNPRSQLGEIDPSAPQPRLTLGYVVVARLDRVSLAESKG